MQRRDPNNRRKIPRISSRSVHQNLQLLLKISVAQQALFVAVAIYLLVLLVFIGRPFLATALLGGGSLIFAAFRLRDLNQKLKLYLENESVTNLERITNTIALMWLLFTFLFFFGILALITVQWDTFLHPFTSFLN